MVRILKNTSFLVILLLLLAHGFSMAQDPSFNHYTEDDELPSNQVYGLAQDENQILYMVTDKGVVIYDGYEFKTLTVKDGLKDNCVLRINQDQFNRIWLTTLANTSNYIEQGQLKQSPFSDALSKMDAHEHYVQHIFVSRENQIIINYDLPGVYAVDSSNNLVKITNHLNQVDGATICIIELENGYYWDLLEIPEIDPDFKSQVEVVENRYYITTKVTSRTDHHRKELVKIGDREFLFSHFTRLFHFKDGKYLGEKVFEKEILSLNYDTLTNDVWIGFSKGGTRRYQEANLDGQFDAYLDSESVASILIDHERNYWFSTTDNGVFRANNLDFPTYKVNSVFEGDNRITALAATDSVLFFGTYSGRLFKMRYTSSSDFEMIPIDAVSGNGIIRRIHISSQGTILIFSNSLFEIDSNGKLVNLKKYQSYPYAFIDLPDGNRLISQTSGIRIFTSNTEYTEFNQGDGYMKVTEIFRANDGKYWFSSRPYGIFSWSPGDSVPQKVNSLGKLKDQRSLSFSELRGNMVLAPAGYGIVINQPDTLISINMQDNGLSSDIIDALLVQDSNLIWAGTNNGINRIQFGEKLTDRPEISIFNTRNGLPSNKVNNLVIFKGDIWAGTGRGLVQISQNSQSKPPLAKPFFEYLIVNEADTVRDTLKWELGPRHPYDLKFRFKSISYYQPHNIYYHYFMDGVDDDNWTSTRDQEVRYPGLHSGDYTLYIRADISPSTSQKGIPENLDGYSVFSVQIDKQVYEKSLFKVLVALLAALVAFLLVRMIIKDIRERERNKQRLLLAEKNALMAQMNPHFIFNSLNSIQHYIIEQDAENANLYLAKFSKLIRKILDNSKKKQIPLKEEIDTITLYLNLEKLRFEDRFDFKLKKSADLDPYGIMIPPMLIQPFVENAIWHGLMPLNTKGILSIIFKRQGARMIVIIEDNGVGRQNAGKKKRIMNHAPTGVKNVSERIELINKMNPEPIFLNTIDLMEPDGTAKGTRVELSIPISNQDE